MMWNSSPDLVLGAPWRNLALYRLLPDGLPSFYPVCRQLFLGYPFHSECLRTHSVQEFRIYVEAKSSAHFAPIIAPSLLRWPQAPYPPIRNRICIGTFTPAEYRCHKTCNSFLATDLSSIESYDFSSSIQDYQNVAIHFHDHASKFLG